ncbi:glutathione peroxidase [Hahella ganghwensis]|uniref:glutathione peroxidase n=1 Tax=Hahella ganghwensis TaxID=286420 RepID=UPI00037B989A|nr:glutathione peroxidase [Hahella ganghwensis]
MGIYDFTVEDIQGNEKSLADYKGKVLLVVNTASKCGFTPQFKGLEKLYNDHKDEGFEILGFPCNQFMQQDPGTNSEIAEFCELNYGVSFPMFAKIDVNGDNTHPLYQFLKKEAKGVLGSEGVKWNFTKFLVDRDGKVVERFPPTAEPSKLEKPLQKLLGK